MDRHWTFINPDHEYSHRAWLHIYAMDDQYDAWCDVVSAVWDLILAVWDDLASPILT